MTKMHQILAVEKDVRTTADRRITDGYQALQKPTLLSGLSRVYTPDDDEGDKFPSEYTKAQVNARQVIADQKAEFENLWNVTATKDWGNLSAKADVVLENGTVLIKDAPTTYLLWLEKQINDIHTIVSKLPVLDPATDWTWDDDKDIYVSTPVQSIKTKKVMKVLTKAEATDKHPAQAETYTEDVRVGIWTTVAFSGALPAADVRKMLDRVNEVRKAVKEARAKANEADIQQQTIAAPVLDYLFG